MRRVLYICFIVSSLILILAGCGNGRKGRALHLEGAQDYDPLPKQGGPTELEGNWGVCSRTDGLGVGLALTFAGSAIRAQSIIHKDSGCKIALLKVRGMGSFKIGSAVDKPAGAKAIDIVMSTISVTPLEAAVVTALNENESCGLKNWELGKPQDVTKSICATDGFAAILRKQYGIFNLGDKKLYWGKAGKKGSPTDGSEPGRRPTELQSPPLVSLS